MKGSKLIIKIIEIYQKTISPDHGLVLTGAMRCRFYPSCSEYTKLSVAKHGVLAGLAKGFLRLLRCNPLFGGGIDNP